jgi:hypothetical protein
LDSKRLRVIFAYGLEVGEIKIRIQGTNKSLGRKKWVTRLQDLCDYYTHVHSKKNLIVHLNL